MVFQVRGSRDLNFGRWGKTPRRRWSGGRSWRDSRPCLDIRCCHYGLSGRGRLMDSHRLDSSDSDSGNSGSGSGRTRRPLRRHGRSRSGGSPSRCSRWRRGRLTSLDHYLHCRLRPCISSRGRRFRGSLLFFFFRLHFPRLLSLAHWHLLPSRWFPSRSDRTRHLQSLAETTMVAVPVVVVVVARRWFVGR